MAAVSWAGRVRGCGRPAAAGRIWSGEERSVEGAGAERTVLADHRGRQARHHGVRGRQAVHDRLSPCRWQRSVARGAPAKEIEPFYKTRWQPGRIDLRDRRRADRFLLRICGLFCYDPSGKELWKYEMPAAATVGGFGTGTSPVLADGIVVVVREEVKDPKIVVVDVATVNSSGKRNGSRTPRSERRRCGTRLRGSKLSCPAFGG